jgi:hypothetical protein
VKTVDFGLVKTGKDLIALISEHPTLDEVLDRDPHSTPLSDDELERLIVALRQDRAAAEVKTEERRQTRKGKSENG